MGDRRSSGSRTGGNADRAVTTALRYALLLVIVAVLVSGLFVGVGEFVETQQERAIGSQLETVGNRLAGDLATASRLVETGSGSAAEPTVALRTRLPDTVAGSEYRIEVDGTGPEYTLTLWSVDPVVEASVVVRSSTDIDTGTTVPGGRVLIEYDGSELVMNDG